MPEPMDRLNAALEGRYRVESHLGEGGMATVYLADDLKHERKVALKVLKPELAAVVGGERFLGEIKTTANLQHPHILPLFDSGEADGFLFYVMPYVEGETLRARIDRDKQLGVEEAIRLAKGVAGALDYAHRHGVIHRDVKPENVLLHDGEPLVADFGIALAVTAAGGGRLTETGLSLGTPYYMSPEQAAADRDPGPQSDVYSLACILYEMLIGDPPHTGSSAQAVLAKILTEKPRAVTDLRETVPRHVGSAIARGLERLPADRFSTAAAFSEALDDIAFSHVTVAQATTATGGEAFATSPESPKRWATILPWAIAAIATGVALYPATGPEASATSPVPLRTVLSDFAISTGGGQKLAISRDGSKIAVTTNNDGFGPYRLFVRNVDQLEFREIDGTSGGVYPTFSPNGEWIAFSGRNSNLRRVQLSGGPVLPVADGSQPHWGVEETIVFRGPDNGLYLVSPAGGDATPIVDASSAEGAAVTGFHPHLLPDGKAVLFEARALDGGNRPLRMVDVESGVVTDLGIEGNRPQYSASNHLLYGHSDQVLMAVPFDLDTHQVTGEPSTVLLDVGVGGVGTAFVVSETGTAFYGGRNSSSGGRQRQRLLVVGLDGSEEPMPLEPREFREPRWSPDGEWVAYRGSEPGADPGESDIYLYNVDLRFTPTRLTGEGNNWSPVWSPDGTRVAFASDRGGGGDIGLFVKDLGDTPAELILRADNLIPTQWLFEDLLLFNDGRPTNDLWYVDPIADSAVATRYADEEALLSRLAVSPNRSLAAYVSNQSGRFEVYVRAFPDPGQANVVSQGGGAAPFWAPDGNTLYYWTLGSAPTVKHVVAAQIDLGPPFTVTAVDTVITGAYRWDSSDLHPDGDRIIVSQEAVVAGGGTEPAQETEAPRHFIVVNWFEELRERMGGN